MTVTISINQHNFSLEKITFSNILHLKHLGKYVYVIKLIFM